MIKKIYQIACDQCGEVEQLPLSSNTRPIDEFRQKGWIIEAEAKDFHSRHEDAYLSADTFCGNKCQEDNQNGARTYYDEDSYTCHLNQWLDEEIEALKALKGS